MDLLMGKNYDGTHEEYGTFKWRVTRYRDGEITCQIYALSPDKDESFTRIVPKPDVADSDLFLSVSELVHREFENQYFSIPSQNPEDPWIVTGSDYVLDEEEDALP